MSNMRRARRAAERGKSGYVAVVNHKFSRRTGAPVPPPRAMPALPLPAPPPQDRR